MAEQLVARSFVTPDGRMALWFWSNEDGVTTDPAWSDSPAGALAIAGHLNDVHAAREAAITGRLAQLERALDASGGVYSGCAAAAAPAELRAWNTLVRVESVYWQEFDGRVAVSNRPLLAHLVARAALDPRYDVASLLPFLNTGYYASEQTPFEGLNVLPQNSELRITGNGVSVTSRGDRGAPPGDPLDAILAALARSCEPVRRTGRPIACNLTGGRDSRLLAATLRAAGLEFHAVTKGPPTHPDVVLAKRVAEVLGVEHRGSPDIGSRASDIVIVDIASRVAASLRATDGLASAYDNIPAANARFDARAVVNGVGGELFRGGYAKGATPAEMASPDRLIRRVWLAARRFLRADVTTAYETLVRTLGDAEAGEAGPAVLDHIYLRYRTGRWVPVTRMATAAAYQFFQPLFDSQVIDAVRRVPLADRLDERLIFDLTRRLSPRLVELPLVGTRWGFEAAGPAEADDQAWRRREPLSVPLTAGNTIDWRRTRGGQLDRALRERLLDQSRAAPLFDLVDRAALERTLGGTWRHFGLGVRRYAEAQFLWAAYTADVLLSDEWLAPVTGPHPVRIRVRPTPLDRVAVRGMAAIRWARSRLRTTSRGAG